MAYPKGFARDLEGKVVPFGQTKVTYEASFTFGEALPSWLTVTSGTGASIANNTSNAGYYMVSTPAATAGSKAQIATSKIALSQYEAVMLEVDGLYWSSNYALNLAADVAVGVRNISPDASAGALLMQATTDADTAKIAVAGESGANATPMPYQMRTMGEADKRRNVGVLLLPKLKQTIVFESGITNIIGWKDSTAMGTGLAQGLIEITAQEAVTHALRFTTARLTLWKN